MVRAVPIDRPSSGPIRNVNDPLRTLGCERKASYTTENKAREIAHRSLNTQSGGPGKLYVYACGACRGWHLTKSSWNNALPPVSKRSLYHGQRDDMAAATAWATPSTLKHEGLMLRKRKNGKPLRKTSD